MHAKEKESNRKSPIKVDKTFTELGEYFNLLFSEYGTKFC